MTRIDKEKFNVMLSKISIVLNTPYTVLKFLTFVLLLITVVVLFKWGQDYVIPILILYAMAFYLIFTRLDSIQEQLKRL